MFRLKVDSDQLKRTINTIEDDTDYINEQIDYLISQMEDLKNVWQGDDATSYIDNAEDYLSYIKSVPQICSDLSSVMRSANKYYKKTDKKYAQYMKKAGVSNE